VTDTFDAPVERVWPHVSAFGDIDKYMRGIESLRLEGEGIGADRVIGTPGGEIVERLTWLDDDAYSLSYTIVSGPMPVSRYVATVKLSPDGERCGIEWIGRFEPKGVSEEEAEKIFRGVYVGGIKGFKKALEG
jgi:hypothetical protein